MLYTTPPVKDLTDFSIYNYSYLPVENEPFNEKYFTQHGFRLINLETRHTSVLTTPIIDIDTIQSGSSITIETKSESLLNPKRNISHYIISVLKLGIKNAIYYPYPDGSLSFSIFASDSLIIGDEIVVEVQAVDDLGNKSNIVRQILTVVFGFINTPEIIKYSEDGIEKLLDKDVIYYNLTSGMIVKTKPFKSDYPDRHLFTDWKITKDTLGFDIVESSLKSRDLVQHTFINPDLKDSTLYYLWVRFYGFKLGYSTWSKASFVAKKVRIKTPEIVSTTTKVKDITRYSMQDYITVPLEADTSNVLGVAIRKEHLVVKTKYPLIIEGAEDIHITTLWKASTDIKGLNIFHEGQSIDTIDSYNIPYSPEMKNREPFYVFCKYVTKNYGMSDWSNPAIFVPELGVILTPRVLSPEADSIVILNNGFQVDASDYITQYSEDVYTGTQFKITEDMAGKSILKIKDSDTNKCFFTFEDLKLLDDNTRYYLFASHYGTVLSPSEWSEPVPFIANVGGIRTPRIQSPVNKTLYKINDPITVVAGDFETFRITDTHVSSDWKITTDILGEYPILLGEEKIGLIENSSDLTEHLFENYQLTSASKYYLWVRYNGASGVSSNWSDCVEIKAISGETEVCQILSPEPNKNIIINYKDDLVVRNSTYSCLGEPDYYKKTYFRISSDTEIVLEKESIDNKVTFTQAELNAHLEPSKTYYIIARNEGTLYPLPEWSLPVSFHTLYASIGVPSIIAPIKQTIINSDFFCVCSEFESYNLKDDLLLVDWRFSSDKNGNNVLKTYQTSEKFITLNKDIFSIESVFVSCRHKGERLGWGEFGKSVEILFWNSLNANSRRVYRHFSQLGSVIEFNDNGVWRRVLVLDAQYRFAATWEMLGRKIPTQLYNARNIRSNWYIDGVSRNDVFLAPTTTATNLTENELNSIWIDSISDITNKECCDMWVEGSNAVRQARNITIEFDGYSPQKCDIPNFQTLLRIYCEADAIDSLDSSLASNKTKGLGSSCAGGWWRPLGTTAAWSTNQYDENNLRVIDQFGTCSYKNKAQTCMVIPIVEL